MTRIHITADMEDAILAEVKRCEDRLDDCAISTIAFLEMFEWQARIDALQWVLHLSRAELDE